MRSTQRGITLDQKLKYLKEVEGIHALSRKVRPPAGKSWRDIADARYRHVMGQPILEPQARPMQVRAGKLHHEHDPRSARLIERTLKTGIVPDHVLHSYHTGMERSHGRFKFKNASAAAFGLEPLAHDDMRVQHMVQHVGAEADLHYPHGHMQGEGFVPRQHEVNSHVPLQPVVPAEMGTQVPTRGGLAAGAHYH